MSFLPKLGAPVALLALLPAAALAQPRITEFAAINAASLTDGDGNTPDWIEVHNPGADRLDISGYHLTDDPELPARYTFPPETTIPAGGYLVVFASGRSEPDYTDAAGHLHTTFSLDGGGEYLALNAPDGSVLQAFAPAYPRQFEDVSYGAGTEPAPTVLVAAGAPASWLVPGSDIGDAWQLPDFDAAGWNTAETGIGYRYDELIGPGGDTRDEMWFVRASAYLRVPFQVDDPAAITSLQLQMRYEDGFVAYLNGKRVASSNAPGEGDLNFSSSATAERPDGAAAAVVTFPVPVDSLVAGANVLAFHGLNASLPDADFLLLPELWATSDDPVASFGYFTAPTPGETNGPTPLLGFVADTKFSHRRGYYTAPFDLEMTTGTSGATLVYTTDGTPPSALNGEVYAAPVRVDATSTVRAMAFKPGFQPTNIDTQTYLFVDDIVRQRRPAGYPATWGGVQADYDMDPEIVDHPDYAGLFHGAFAALPTLSLVFDPDALFHPSTGIYQNPLQEGAAWERPLSVEFFVPDGSEPGFQIDAGVRIQGGSSRNTDTPKHALSLRFRADYGAEKLRYPLFEGTPGGDSALDRFDLLQLRPEYNFGWMHRHWYQARYALYGRDQWASDLFVAMGQNGSRGRWTHLFLNGVYWGLYDVHERPDADHMANYFGGTDEDYDTVNSSRATNGDLVAFNAMMDLAYGSIESPATYAAIQGYLDVDAFIDYMILNAYVGNRDWDGHNWRAARRREPGAGYLFFPWDTEFVASHVPGGSFNPPPEFFSTALHTDVTGNNGNRRPTGLQRRLERNEEYRLRYADRVRAHFFNGGPLTPARALAMWTVRSAPMREAVVAESARWGDFRRDVLSRPWRSDQYELYTRDEHYLPVHDWLVETYIPQRTGIVLGQLRARGLYPGVDAPDFSPYGGTVARGFEVRVDAPTTVYYTTDGSDPRLAGGGINPAAQTLAPGSAIPVGASLRLMARTRALLGDWSALTEAFFSVGAADLRVSEIMYRPAGEPLAEFIELENSGDFPVSLAGLQFTRGIAFDFDLHASIGELAPGARLLIVRDLDAFRAVYGDAFDAIIAGTFQGGTALANDGETLALTDANGTEVWSVAYNDGRAWPAEADGGGHSLVPIGDDLLNPLNWRASAGPGGNPGTTDSTAFTGGDLLAYALAAPLQMSRTAAGEITLALTTHLTADEALATVQQSTDLEAWENVDLLVESQVLGPGPTRTTTFALPASGDSVFVRLLVRLTTGQP